MQFHIHFWILKIDFIIIRHWYFGDYWLFRRVWTLIFFLMEITNKCRFFLTNFKQFLPKNSIKTFSEVFYYTPFTVGGKEKDREKGNSERVEQLRQITNKNLREIGGKNYLIKYIQSIQSWAAYRKRENLKRKLGLWNTEF